MSNTTRHHPNFSKRELEYIDRVSAEAMLKVAVGGATFLAVVVPALYLFCTWLTTG